MISTSWSATVTHLLGNLGRLLNWHLVTALNWDLLAVFLGDLLALLDWVLDWHLLAVLTGDLVALSHGLLDWDLLAALLRYLLTLLTISSSVAPVAPRADLFVCGGTLLFVGCLVSS